MQFARCENLRGESLHFQKAIIIIWRGKNMYVCVLCFCTPNNIANFKQMGGQCVINVSTFLKVAMQKFCTVFFHKKKKFRWHRQGGVSGVVKKQNPIRNTWIMFVCKADPKKEIIIILLISNLFKNCTSKCDSHIFNFE